MPDLTFQQLADAAPSGSIVFANGKVTIYPDLIMGQSLADLSAIGVAEFMFKLMNSANKAQIALNIGNTTVGTRLNSFSTPTYGTPQLDATTGTYFSTASATVSVKAPVNNDAATGTVN